MSPHTDESSSQLEARGRSVIFGGGAIGRGFIGEIFLDAGWAVTFVDASPELVAALSSGSYPHDTVSTSGVSRKLLSGYKVLSTHNTEAIRYAVVEADVIFTCVGASNLPRLAATLAAALVDRACANRGPVDLFLAENLHDGAEVMHGLLADALRQLDVPDVRSLMEMIGLVETSIGRMIPVQTLAQRREHPALVAAEPFRGLPFDLAACRAPVPDVPELMGRDDVDFSFYADRKLYIHNHGHCLTAYLGALAGQQEIAPTIGDERIFPLVRAAMCAAAQALAAKYEQSLPSLVEHVDDLLERFANVSLHDTVERVGRDPERKLQPDDRFLGTLSLTAQWGEPSLVLPGIALAAHQLALSRPSESHLAFVAPVRREIARVSPHLVGLFDGLLTALFDGASLDEFTCLLATPTTG